MKKFCTSAAALAVLLVSAATALAGDCCCCTCETPKPTPPRRYLEIKFTPITMEVTDYKLVCREVVNYVKCTELVPYWTEKQHTVTTYTKVAREIEKEVMTCKMVPECVCDPCTGCMKTCYKPQVCVHKVKCCVWECVPCTQVVTEKVCCMKPQEKVVAQKCIVKELEEDTHNENVVLVTFEPYAGKLPPLPPCPPAPPVAPAPSCSGCGK